MLRWPAAFPLNLAPSGCLQAGDVDGLDAEGARPGTSETLRTSLTNEGDVDLSLTLQRSMPADHLKSSTILEDGETCEHGVGMDHPGTYGMEYEGRSAFSEGRMSGSVSVAHDACDAPVVSFVGTLGRTFGLTGWRLSNSVRGDC